MGFRPDVAQRLRDRAATAPAPTASELEEAAARIASYSSAPGNRKQVERMAKVLTPAVVEALGDAFIDIRTDEIDNPVPHQGPDFRQGDHALGAVLIAAADPDLAGPALPAVEGILALVPRMLPRQAEHIFFLTGLFPELDAADRLRAAAAQVLGRQPETVGEAWSRELGLGLPEDYWSVSLSLDPVVPEKEEDDPLAGLVARWFDAIVYMEITNYHGDRTDWSIRIGTMSTQVLGGSARPSMYGHDELGRYDRKGCDPSDEGIAGSVSPVQGPPDFPRVLAELEAAHPALRYDYAKLSASGRPGRLLPPTRKRQLISWLSRA